ncbi:MAG: hypothetical protein ACRD2C_13170 [Acidimicrobiales bacterium]
MPADHWSTSSNSADHADRASDRSGRAAADRPRGPEPRIGDNPPQQADDADGPRTKADGTWAWKGHRLEAADNESADRGLDRRREVEPAITSDMRAIEASLTHGRLEDTLKSADRFKEKLAQWIDRNPGAPTGKVETEIHDGIRYTFNIDDADYTAGVADVQDRLNGMGYELRWQKNSWDNPEYKGVNSRWVTYSGEMIEVQFHTPASWETKQATHDAYEELADPRTTSTRRHQLHALQRDMTAAIPVPPGAREIQNYPRNEP